MFPNQPNQPGQNSGLQQNQNGQYEVVPPPLPGANAGHTGHNPYEFIMDPNAAKPKAKPLGRVTSSWKSLVLIGGGLMVVLIVVGVVLSSLAPKGSMPGITSAAQSQQEIIRIAAAATTSASSQDVKNFAINTQISVGSSQQQTLGYLANHGKTLKDKQLALSLNPQTDTLLTTATAAGNYDSVATQTLVTQLQTYEQLLQTTYKQATSTQVKALLQSNYSTADKLLAQAKTVSTTN